MARDELQFAAFLSYSRQDRRLALWLVRALEEFRPPRQTVAELEAGKSSFTAARPIFRDESDMPVGGPVPARLAEVLDASAAMIVLCTPASARSDWVNEEIRRFSERHPDRPIIPAVAEGDPDAEGCYPAALLALGKPLAADLRDPRERRQAVVKIAAAILGLDVDRLVGRVRKRDAERSRRLTAIVSAAAVVVAGLGVTASLMADRARRANDLARAGVEVLLTDTREQVSAAGLLSAKLAVHEAAEAYFDGKKPGDLTDKDLQLKAEMLLQKGQDASDRGADKDALQFRQAAFAATEELLSRKRDDPDRLFDHGQSAFWVGEYYYQRGDLEQARRYFEIYRAASQRLLEVKPDYPGAVLEMAWANTNMGVLAVEQRRDPRGGEALFGEAVAMVAPLATDTETRRNLTLAYGYQAQALAQFEGASRVLSLADRWEPIIGALETARLRDRTLNLDVASDLNLLGELEKRGGRMADGLLHKSRALVIAQEALRNDPENRRWLEQAAMFELNTAEGLAKCQAVNEVRDLDFAKPVDGYQAAACLRRASTSSKQVCTKFVAWLPAQKPNFGSERVWAAILSRCSRDPSVSADATLMDALDRLAEARFFSIDPHGLSLWTQMELAQFKSASRNADRVRALAEDLKRRGWNAYQS